MEKRNNLRKSNLPNLGGWRWEKIPIKLETKKEAREGPARNRVFMTIPLGYPFLWNVDCLEEGFIGLV